jgi:hypothetical protein
MDVSRGEISTAKKRRHRAIVSQDAIGLCLKCGHRLTLCGKPFTADITCSKCSYINSFKDSQKPISGRDMESAVIT